MELSGDIKIETIENVDLNTLGFSYEKGWFFADKKRGWYYQFDTGVSAGSLEDPMRLYRYDLDFNIEENWSPNDTYGASQYGASYREGKPYYDEGSGDFFVLMSVNDDLLGITPSASDQYLRWVRWHIDQDNLDSTTVSIYSTFGGETTQQSVRQSTPIYIDQKNRKIYLQRGQAGTVGASNNSIVKYDIDTNTNDVSFFDSSLEGGLIGFDFDIEQEILKGFLTRFGVEAAGIYDTIYFEFDFKTETLTHTSSNTLVGFTQNDIDFKVYDDIIDVTVWTNLYSTASIPMTDEFGIQRYIFDRDLNLLDLRAASDPNTYDPPVYFDKIEGEIIGFNTNGRFFKRLVEVQENTNRPIISGEDSYNKVIYDEDTNITGASAINSFYVFDYDYAWRWGVGAGNGGTVSNFEVYDGYGQTLLHTIDFPDYETFFRSGSQETYFDGKNTFINTLARRSDQSLRYIKIEVDLENNFSLTYSELGTVIRPDGVTQSGGSYNGGYRIFDYIEEDNLIYVLNTGFSGNYGNGGNGSRFMKYDTVSETNTDISQNWRGTSPELTGRQYRFRDLRIDPLTEKITFPAANQEDTFSNFIAEYDYKNDILATYSIFQGSPSIGYIDLDSSNYIFFGSSGSRINAYIYDGDTYEFIKQIQGEELSTYQTNIVYDQKTKDVVFSYSNVFQNYRYKRRLALLQEDPTDPQYDDDRFEILTTAASVSIFGTSGFISGGNIDTFGVDEARNSIYILVNGQPSGANISLYKTDLDFNLIDTYDIQIEGNYQSADLREVNGIYDTQSSTIYTALREPSNRVLGKIEIDHATLSSSTVSTIVNYSSTVGNGTFVYMLGIVDDILYWNHGYQQNQAGKETYFRSININTDTEVSGVFLGTYSHITNFYFDQDDLKVYYSLNVDNIRYVYDYNVLTQSVTNPYPAIDMIGVIHRHLPSGENPDKLVGYTNALSGFKEVTVNYVSNTYMSNIESNFDVGIGIQYITSNDILYGNDTQGNLYKIQKK